MPVTLPPAANVIFPAAVVVSATAFPLMAPLIARLPALFNVISLREPLAAMPVTVSGAAVFVS